MRGQALSPPDAHSLGSGTTHPSKGVSQEAPTRCKPVQRPATRHRGCSAPTGAQGRRAFAEAGPAQHVGQHRRVDDQRQQHKARRPQHYLRLDDLRRARRRSCACRNLGSNRRIDPQPEKKFSLEIPTGNTHWSSQLRWVGNSGRQTQAALSASSVLTTSQTPGSIRRTITAAGQASGHSAMQGGKCRRTSFCVFWLLKC